MGKLEKGKASGRKASSSFFEKKEPKKLLPTLGGISTSRHGASL
jgi:hypothetical protein